MKHRRISIIVLFFCILTVFGQENASLGPHDYWSLIIGIGEYMYQDSGLDKLKYAASDASAVHKLLLTLGWNNQRIKLICNENATRRNIDSALKGWLRQINKNDLLIVYWAGHGYPDLTDPRRVYFACHDTDMKKPWTGYRMDKVVKAIKEHKIRNVIFIADTCHAGKIITRSDGKKGLAIQPYIDNIHKNKDIPPGWVFMAAAGSENRTIENEIWRSGVFTYCFLKAAKGETANLNYKPMTLGAIKDYLLETVPVESRKVTDVELRPQVVTNSSKSDIWNITIDLR